MILTNSYELPNKAHRLTYDELVHALQDFNYLTSNFQQILGKDRRFDYMHLNAFQQKVFKVLLPMIMPETRLEQRHNVILLKPRQVGASTGIVTFVNYLCSFVENMTHLNIIHTFPVGDTLSKFYKQKIAPIITGIHPDLFPTIEHDPIAKGDTSVLTHYKDLRGKIVRDNYYELASANSQSIRSSSATVWLADELGFYKNPEALEDALSPALPDFGFSLVVYLSTFQDKGSSYFLDKIKIAMEEPDDWTLIFTPWFEMYPEQFRGNQLDVATISDYERNVILPALVDSGCDEAKFGDYLDWYRRKSKTTTRMFNEYPTTLDEVLEFGDDQQVFPKECLDYVKSTIERGRYYNLSQDVSTGEVIANATEESALKIYRAPVHGHRYVITVDPITSNDEKSDYFAASVWDKASNEQVATLLGRNRPIEDWADLTYALALLYNRAMICPEANLAQSLVLLIRQKGYYNWYYLNDKNRAAKKPGIITSASTKGNMVDRLTLLLKNQSIIIHDENTLEQMENFIYPRNRKDERSSGKMEARKGHHDDQVAAAWIYAGMLDSKSLFRSSKHSKFGWVV